MRALQQQKAKIVTEMRSISSAPAGEGGDLNEEQETRFHNLTVDLEKLEKRIERQRLIDEADRQAEGISLVNGPGDFERECRAFSLMKAIQHQMGIKVDAGREVEVSAELARQEGRASDGILAPYSIFERRADTITTGQPSTGPGSNLVGTDHLGGQFIDLLREANPLIGLGVRNIPGLRGNVDLPKGKRGTSVGWTAENTEIPQTDAAFDKVTMAPHHVGAVMQYSRNMFQQTSPDLESILRSDSSQEIAFEVARATINGTGTGAEPLGILKTPGIQKITKPSAVMDYAPDLANALFLKNVGNIGFMVNSGFKNTVDKLLTADGLPIGAATFFRNYPHRFASIVPTDNVMIAGDFSQVIQGMWSSVEILVNPYAESAYKRGNIMLRIILTMDVAVRHPEAFAVFEA